MPVPNLMVFLLLKVKGDLSTSTKAGRSGTGTGPGGISAQDPADGLATAHFLHRQGAMLTSPRLASKPPQGFLLGNKDSKRGIWNKKLTLRINDGAELPHGITC